MIKTVYDQRFVKLFTAKYPKTISWFDNIADKLPANYLKDLIMLMSSDLTYDETLTPFETAQTIAQDFQPTIGYEYNGKFAQQLLAPKSLVIEFLLNQNALNLKHISEKELNDLSEQLAHLTKAPAYSFKDRFFDILEIPLP